MVYSLRDPAHPGREGMVIGVRHQLVTKQGGEQEFLAHVSLSVFNKAVIMIIVKLQNHIIRQHRILWVHLTGASNYIV